MRLPRTACSVIPVLALALLAGCGGRETPGEGTTAPGVADTAASSTADTAPVPASAPDVAGGAAAASTDVRPLAGQSEDGVRAMLGTPTGCEDVPRGRRCTYPRGQSEVVYIDGMADHIVIADLAGAPFEPATIARIGLGGAEPLEVTPDAIRWQNVGGMREIVLERGPDGRAGRFVIKTMTL